MLCVVVLTLFSILDAVFTLTLLARGGSELNPIMNYFLGIGVAPFMVAKMLLTTIPAIVLIASSNLMLFNTLRARSVLGALIGMYAGLLMYEVGLLWMSA